jgi:hypothetical protein
MPFSRVVPNQDGFGVVDRVGPSVDHIVAVERGAIGKAIVEVGGENVRV